MRKDLLEKVNEYMFNKRESIIVQRDAASDDPHNNASVSKVVDTTKFISIMQCNLLDLGYKIKDDDLYKLWELTPTEINELVYQPLLQMAKEAKGVHVEHKLLFPGFPDSVNAIDINTLSDIRFWSYFTSFVDNAICDQDPLKDGSVTRRVVDTFINDALQRMNSAMYSSKNFMDRENLKTVLDDHQVDFVRPIGLVDESEYFQMVKNMLSGRTSLSEYDKLIVQTTIDNFPSDRYMPEKVTFKETQALLDQYNFSKGYLQNIDIKSFKDFERLLASLSDSDVSLSKKTHVKNFSNQERKQLYRIFEKAIESNRPIMKESMANRHAMRFEEMVLRKRLHFNQYGGAEYNQFIQEAKHHHSVMSKYEARMHRGDYCDAAMTLVVHSPTLFIQHFREIAGKAGDNPTYQQSLLNILKSNAKKVNIKTLMQLQEEIKKPHNDFKVMFPKGPTTRILFKENKSVIIPEQYKQSICDTLHDAIVKQIKSHEMEGSVQIKEGTKVFIDPNLKDCPIPTVGRGDTGKNRTLAVGTKVPVHECDILRAALYKKNPVDQFIDFSAGILDENYNLIDQVSWNNLKSQSGRVVLGYHSGDTNACRNGCTEVIDMKLENIKGEYPNAKYITYCAVMWNANPLSTCDELFMTLQPTEGMRLHDGLLISKNNANCVLDASDIQFKMDLTGDAKGIVPLIYNIDEHKITIVNIQTQLTQFWSSNLASQKVHFNLHPWAESLEKYHGDMARMCFAFDNMQVPSIKDLANYYVEAKEAVIVESPEAADVIYAIDRMEIVDKRPEIDAETKVPQVVISSYDKDIIAAELVFEPDKDMSERQKDVSQSRTQKHIFERQDKTEERYKDFTEMAFGVELEI